MPIDDKGLTVFGASWSVGCAPSQPAELERMRRAYSEQVCRDAGGGQVTPNVLGEGSCMVSDGQRGTLDIQNYGDPYTGGARIFLATPGGVLTVSTGLALHTSREHGPRGRPEVIQAAKKSAEDWAKVIAGRLMGQRPKKLRRIED